MQSRPRLVFILSIILFPLAFILYTSIVFAQDSNPEINPKTLIELYQLLGWPGAIAGAIVVGIGTWRKMAPRVWDTWPRWARFSLGFLAPALGAAASSLIAGGLASWPTALTLGIGAGVAAIFSVEASKSLGLQRKATRVEDPMSGLRSKIRGPGGTGI